MDSERRVEFRVDGPERFLVQLMGSPDFLLEQLEWVKQAVQAFAQKPSPAQKPSALDTSIEDLELSVRSYNALWINAGLRTVGEIVRRDFENPRIKNFGRKSAKEVREVLAKRGIDWGKPLQEKPNGHQAAETGSGTRTQPDMG